MRVSRCGALSRIRTDRTRAAVGSNASTSDDALEFQFHGDSRDAVFRELVSTPGLRARIAVDTADATGREILSVTFRGRA
jgi:hypothetical protein